MRAKKNDRIFRLLLRSARCRLVSTDSRFKVRDARPYMMALLTPLTPLIFQDTATRSRLSSRHQIPQYHVSCGKKINAGSWIQVTVSLYFWILDFGYQLPVHQRFVVFAPCRVLSMYQVWLATRVRTGLMANGLRNRRHNTTHADDVQANDNNYFPAFNFENNKRTYTTSK